MVKERMSQEKRTRGKCWPWRVPQTIPPDAELTQPLSSPAPSPRLAAREHRHPSVNPPVDRAALERKAQQVFGPEAFASDLFWDALGAMGGLHWLLVPLRDRVQALARKYRKRPLTFVRKFQQIYDQRIKSERATPEGKKSLEIKAWYDRRVGEHQEAMQPSHPHTKPSTAEQPLALTQGLSQRKLDATEYLLPWLSALNAGRPVKVEPKKLRAKIITLFSLRPGSEPDDTTKEVRRIDSQARAEGRHLSDGAIAAQVFKWYAQSKSDRKSQARQAVKDARLPL